jgi:hypothetical protein
MGPAAQATGVSARGFAFLGFAIIWICIFGFSIDIWIGKARTQFRVRACNFQMFSEFTSSGFKGRNREVFSPISVSILCDLLPCFAIVSSVAVCAPWLKQL